MTISNRTTKYILMTLLSLQTMAASAEEISATLAQQKQVSVTIYNSNLALIKDRREVSLPIGEHQLAIRGVSAQIRPETSILTSINAPQSISLIEQNFDYDLLTPAKLLDKYVGKQVRIISTNTATGEEKTEQAVVLSTNQGVVLKYSDRIETGVPGRIIYDRVPSNLRDKPTLTLMVENQSVNAHTLELSYLSGGLFWQADYVAELNADETELSLNGWVTLNNQSGAEYRDALLQLVAGDVRQVAPMMKETRQGQMMESMAMAAPVSEEALFEYHLYTLGRPTTISDQQTKQVALMSANDIPLKKEYILEGGQDYYYGRVSGDNRQDKIAVWVKLTNNEESQLGIPLPKGIIRAYKNDLQGRVQFIGEDTIDHTPRNHDIRLNLGNVFDVTAKRNQTSFKKQPSNGQYQYRAEIEQTIILKNAKQEAVDVIVRELIPGDWKMLIESSPHLKVSSNLVEWTITVPADSDLEHRYSVLVRY